MAPGAAERAGGRPAFRPRPRVDRPGAARRLIALGPSEHVVALAELELVRGLLDLLGSDETLLGQQLLEGREPDLVVPEGAAARGLRCRDLGDQRLAELLPLVDPLLVQRHRHAEGAPLPRLLEEE